MLLTLGVNFRRIFSALVNLVLKLIELIPICLFHRFNCLLCKAVLEYCAEAVENFFKLILEKDFDEGYTLNDIHNEMAHVAAVKYALVEQKFGQYHN